MITFKQYLQEVRQANLFHGTFVDVSQQILQSNILLPSDRYRTKGYDSKGFNQAISLTRSLKTAIDWRSKSGATLELDAPKLRQNYSVRPVNMHHVWDVHWVKQVGEQPSKAHAKHEELYEEFVTKPIKPLDKYLVSIRIPLSEKYKFEPFQAKYPNTTFIYY